MEASDVELTEDEIEALKKDALEKKRSIVRYERKTECQRIIDNEIHAPWTGKDLLNWIGWRAMNKFGFVLEIDDDNHDVIKALCYYFSNDKRFEQMGDWKLEKGILLAGNIGSGKSSLMRLFCQNKKACYKMISCRKMSDLFMDQGSEVLHTYSQMINVPSSIDTFYQKQIGICFDDLGTERQGKRYGDSANVMEQIILNRYDNSEAPWYYSHITTNLSADEIENSYGSRVRSRMREMYNLISLKGKDRRK